MKRSIEKKTRVLAAAALLFLGGAGLAAGEIVNGIAAKIGRDIITIHEFNSEYDRAKYNALLAGQSPPSREAVMDGLIDELLLEREAARRGIIVTGKEIDGVIEQLKAQNNMNDEQLEAELNRQRMTTDELREQYRLEFLRARLINQMGRSTLYSITDEEIRAFYEDPGNSYLFTKPPVVELAQIVLTIPGEANYQEAVELKDRAYDIYERLVDGEAFKELALEHSSAPNATEGGYLGFFTREQLQSFMQPEDVRYLFSSRQGDIIPPVRLQDGYYIFKVLSRRGETKLSYEEAYNNVQSYLIRRKGQNFLQSWLESAKESTKIEILISME
jgi:peptidyl-prolyl cis-trans isomerase SurA